MHLFQHFSKHGFCYRKMLFFVFQTAICQAYNVQIIQKLILLSVPSH